MIVSLWYLWWILLFHLLFCLFGSLLFSYWAWLKAYRFCFQKTSSWFHWSFFVVVLYFTYFHSDVYHFISSADFEFCSLLLIPLDGSLGCVFEIGMCLLLFCYLFSHFCSSLFFLFFRCWSLVVWWFFFVFYLCSFLIFVYLLYIFHLCFKLIIP